ncbi:hypothetical protein LIER_27756 [Lithospermum erythrorhizon]|uniref:Uncharacterized protein n=1 Tax=Lithospermum erythrorhizon TaxID=34254 RepID=A0AAV3RGU3_LITER
MASSSPSSSGRSPSPEYTPSARHVPVAEYTPFAGGDNVVRRDDQSKALSQSLLNRDLLSRADRQLVDSIVARSSLDRKEAPCVETAVVAHRVEIYTAMVSTLQILQQLLDKEAAVVDQAFRSTPDVGAHYLALEDRLDLGWDHLSLFFPFSFCLSVLPRTLGDPVLLACLLFF